MTYALQLDQHGHPIMLAAPEVAPAQPPQQQQVSADELARRRDAVREAAREFEVLNQQDMRERLRGVTNRPLSEEEVAKFTADVRQHVLDDLVDVLDQQTRGRRRGRRTVRVQAPRGYVKKTVASLSEQEARHVAHRLKARGWTQAELADMARKHLGRARP